MTNAKYTKTENVKKKVAHTLEVQFTNRIKEPIYVNALLGLEADDGNMNYKQL